MINREKSTEIVCDCCGVVYPLIPMAINWQDYVEVTDTDITLANKLAEVFGWVYTNDLTTCKHYCFKCKNTVFAREYKTILY